ncbi:MAG: GDYXXLXY domain-containing protein [Chromatiales bacterium]|nr:GDYXXLXY domain-containing protein [Chromatiales bacterium]
MRKWLALAFGVAILAIVNFAILGKEGILRDGRVLLLELAPVDPRSLMQGDYMALRFAVGRELPEQIASDGYLVLALDADGVGRYRRLDDGEPLAADEVRLRYRVRAGMVRFATNAYFFEEGTGKQYDDARYGEFRVNQSGEALLTGLRDKDLGRLGPDAEG